MSDYDASLWHRSLAQSRKTAALTTALRLAFNTTVPLDRLARVRFGEDLALNYLHCVGGPQDEYRLLRLHKGSEYVPGFDQILLKYNGLEIDRALSLAGTDYHEPGLLDPWDLPPHRGVVIVEAKLTRRLGRIRSYLPFNRSLGVRQMSHGWILERASTHCDPDLGEFIRSALKSDTLERFLIVRFPDRPIVRYFLETDFRESAVDNDRWHRNDNPPTFTSS